ncbi:MAG: NAD(+) synthase [Clostridia bacterium]|nr:NAD(+) synthase [Clostridia bacterium]
MKAGSLKIKCVSQGFRLGDVAHNAENIICEVKKSSGEGVNLLVFPELCLCGYSLRDMLSSPVIVGACQGAIEKIAAETKDTNVLFYVGLPLASGGRLYNGVVSVYRGNLHTVTLKKSFDKKSPFGESRVFDIPTDRETEIKIGNLTHNPHIGGILGIDDENGKMVKFGCVVGNDYTGIKELKRLKADVIVNPTAQIVTVTMKNEREQLAKTISYEAGATLVMCNAGEYESTTDGLFAPQAVLAQKGRILLSESLFDKEKGDPVCEIDAFCPIRRIKPSEEKGAENPRHPFAVENKKEMGKRCALILDIQAHALARRLASSYSKSMVVGISGGLDSTLALIAMVKACDLLDWDRKRITAITMPCFGTTKRTKSNAIDLCKELGVDLREIDILEATRTHLRDIGHDESVRNVTYENAQARERTQILMDVANDIGGIVVGTGDLSEVALGWATYNGDHMAMYNVNSDIPKTMVRHVVSYFAKNSGGRVAKILFDILDTPVSPELLPANKSGEIEQKTEDLVGPYDLHDYFLYNFVGYGFMPSEIYRRGCEAFDGVFDRDTVYKWLCVFIRRFVTQQFKRSASPEGVKIFPVSLSPRGDFNMPSDMSYQAFIDELELNK